MTLREGLLWQLRKGLTQEAVEEARTYFRMKYGKNPGPVFCSLANSPIEGITQDRLIPLGCLLLDLTSE